MTPPYFDTTELKEFVGSISDPIGEADETRNQLAPVNIENIKILCDNNEITDGIQDKYEKNTEDEELQKCRILKTISLSSINFIMGVCVPIFGMTIIHLEKLYNSSSSVMAFTFTSLGCGCCGGAILCGIVFDRSNHELCFTATTTLASIAACAVVFTDNVFGFMACIVFQGVAFGFNSAAAQPYCVNMWLHHRFKKPILLALHAVWSLGAMIGPFVIKPFLIDIQILENDDKLSTATTIHNNTLLNNDNFSISNEIVQLSQENASNFILQLDNNLENFTNTFSKGDDSVDIARARYSFLTIGILIFISGLPFACLYLYECLNKTSSDSRRNRKKKKVPTATLR